MSLDIELVKVLTKDEVKKLKKKHNVTDVLELDKIYFIELEDLVNCDTNLETLNNIKQCLIEKEIAYYNVQAMILKSGVKTKYADLSDYYISGYSFGQDDYTTYEISHMKDEDEVINVENITLDNICSINSLLIVFTYICSSRYY